MVIQKNSSEYTMQGVKRYTSFDEKRDSEGYLPILEVLGTIIFW